MVTHVNIWAYIIEIYRETGRYVDMYTIYVYVNSVHIYTDIYE